LGKKQPKRCLKWLQPNQCQTTTQITGGVDARGGRGKSSSGHHHHQWDLTIFPMAIAAYTGTFN